METFFDDDEEENIDEDTEIEIDDDNITSIINKINNENIILKDDDSNKLKISEDEKKELEIDLDEKHSLANKIVSNSLDVIKNAKLVFTNFSDDVIHGKDRSTSSKEMIIKALEVQNQANKNLIDLAKTLSGNSGNNTNILIASSLSPKKTGIDPNNIKNHFGEND